MDHISRNVSHIHPNPNDHIPTNTAGIIISTLLMYRSILINNLLRLLKHLIKFDLKLSYVYHTITW